jgi:ribosomal protein S18 acetylase RimI-like enzyme
MMIDARDAAVAVGRLHFNSIREAQIRYMAVAVGQQRRGFGSRLLQALEEKAASLGAACIVLDARETALGFYRKQGYSADGPGHVLYNCISHVRMHKYV